jgi:hypothetical protein
MQIENVMTQIDAEIARLQQARVLLVGMSSTGARKGPGRPKAASGTTAKLGKKRVLSAETRKRIADAQRKRWADQRKAAKKVPTKKSATKKATPAKPVDKASEG